MEFFIPGTSPEETEATYEQYAALAGSVPLPVDERIQSISWEKSRVETWTAEVGKKLSGRIDEVNGKGASRHEHSTRLSDSATVLAIFPGDPYMVVTDKGINPDVRSGWANPFMASNSPTSVKRFDP